MTKKIKDVIVCDYDLIRTEFITNKESCAHEIEKTEELINLLNERLIILKEMKQNLNEKKSG